MDGGADPRVAWGGRSAGPRAAGEPEAGTPRGLRAPRGMVCRWVRVARGVGGKGDHCREVAGPRQAWKTARTEGKMRWLRAGRPDRGRGGRGADRARSHVSRLWSASGPLHPRENPGRAVGEHRGRPSRGGMGSRRGGMGGARGRDVRGGRAARATRAPSRPRGGPSSQAGRDGQRRAGERRQVGAARMLRAGRGPESWTLRAARALSTRFRSPCRVPSWSGDARARTSPAPPAKGALGSQLRPLRVLGPGSRDLA